jgi:hypothetical protein
MTIAVKYNNSTSVGPLMFFKSLKDHAKAVFNENIRNLGVPGKPVQRYHLTIEQSFSEWLNILGF